MISLIGKVFHQLTHPVEWAFAPVREERDFRTLPPEVWSRVFSNLRRQDAPRLAHVSQSFPPAEAILREKARLAALTPEEAKDLFYRAAARSKWSLLDQLLRHADLSLVPELRVLYSENVAELGRRVMGLITPERWADARNAPLPPYPQSLREFLEGDCTIWPGKKRHETHIVVPLFPDVLLDGAVVPFSVSSLGELDKNTQTGFLPCVSLGYRHRGEEVPDIAAEREFHWAVMTNDVIPGTRNKSYDEQCRLLPEGYEVPGVFDAARAILWERRRSPGNWRFYFDLFTRCRETHHLLENWQLIVGGLTPFGLYLGYNTNCGKLHIGLAGWMSF